MRMTNARPVTVADMLDARDRRAERQKRFLKTSPVLICLTMNIPGPIKASSEILAAFREGARRVRSAVGARPILYEAFTGPEAYVPLNADAEAVKREMCRIEDEEPLGRLFDLDVLTGSGEKCGRSALGLPPRSCLLCGKPAFACARSRAHSVSELSGEVSRRIDEWRRATLPERIAEAAVNALIREAETTPKPGLVDRRNNGSHPDMSLAMLLRSARSLKPYFRECARAGLTMEEADAFPTLRALGMEAEKTMLCATGGVNAHKGAIFSLGLLTASAAANLRKFEADAGKICARVGSMAAPHMEAHFRSLRAETAYSFGDRLFLAAGLRGARGEAADGFPSVLRVALPALDADVLGNPVTPESTAEMPKTMECSMIPDAEELSGAYALLRLAAETDDTTLIRRGGRSRAEAAKKEIRALLDSGLTREKVETLDDQFIRENLTLGGCADLLACAYFLRAVREI
ncbi:MAG: citrate lyase holo-[acyl-carrier protein] synthase [Clostridia bacterium]|nr:citrate lyase holo-[acyl-carrier protein] synthase [Clostridia bacterium]